MGERLAVVETARPKTRQAIASEPMAVTAPKAHRARRVTTMVLAVLVAILLPVATLAV
jgi:hypothetical protein